MSSIKLRGRLGGLFELGLTLGIFISYIVCYLLLLRDPNDYIGRGKSTSGRDPIFSRSRSRFCKLSEFNIDVIIGWNWYWRIAFGIGGVFGVIGIVIGIFMPESTFLIEKQKQSKANKSTDNDYTSNREKNHNDEEPKKGMQMWKEFFKSKFPAMGSRGTAGDRNRYRRCGSWA